MAMESCVTVTSSCLISPSSSSARNNRKDRMRLCAVSHMLWFVPYRTRFVFFEGSPRLPFESIVTRLKSSLGKALVEFYPLAGRLLLCEDERMDVVCNDKGVLFIEAVADGVSLEELAKNEISGHFEGIPAELLANLAQSGGYNVLKWPWSFDAPLFIIQMTRLSCGGVCMSMKFCHQLLDGTGAWQFFKSWAEISRGEEMSLTPVVLEVPPCLATAQRLDQEEEVPPGYFKFPNSTAITRMGTTSIRSTEFKMRCFSFKKTLVEKMKMENPGFSSFHLLTSLIWRKVTAARQLKDDNTTAFLFAIGCRERLKSVPAGYIGQAVVCDRVSITVKSLLDNDHGLITGALLLKDKIGEVTEESVSFYSRTVSRGRAGHGDGRFTVFPKMVGETDINAGSSFYFPVFQDFGFGKPVGMTILPVLENGKVYYFPGKEKGDIVAYISLRIDAMERLEADHTFVEQRS